MHAAVFLLLFLGYIHLLQGIENLSTITSYSLYYTKEHNQQNLLVAANTLNAPSQLFYKNRLAFEYDGAHKAHKLI